jgi:protein-S-isoprenylcysteine O-methyltransferase Ste14
MSFRERWIDSIHRAATGSRKYRNLMTPVGFLIFLSFLALVIALSLLSDRLFHFPKLLPVPWNAAIYSPIIIVGAFFIFWSVFYFVKLKGTPVPFNPPPKLVSTGPYAYVRNPMVTGVLILLFGLGFAIGSLSLAFIFTPILLILNYYELKKIEEPELELRLGQEYIEYKKRVPMFFPSLKGRAANKHPQFRD